MDKMGLKSYSEFKGRKKKKRREVRTGTRDLITGSVTALLAIPLITETANAVNRV